MKRRFRDDISEGRLHSITCPFCDHEIRTRENVVKCWNCGEAFEREPDEEDFIFGSSGF